MKRNIIAIIAAFGLIASMPVAAVSTGTYNLSNHPDGNARPPLYGLRLDGLLTGSSSEIYTFDFDHASSAMTLVYDGSSIIIDGTAFGGEDAGGGGGYVAGTTAVWDIHFEYLVNVTQPGGEGGLDDVVVTGTGNVNFGMLSSVLGTFGLEDYASTAPVFILGDETGGGHRGFNGISGWGWLNHGDTCTVAPDDCTPHISASDWLFTASPVPVPAAVWLFASGLLGLTGIARRRKQ